MTSRGVSINAFGHDGWRGRGASVPTNGYALCTPGIAFVIRRPTIRSVWKVT